MKLWSVIILFNALFMSEGAGIAEMVSNYARVAVNKGSPAALKNSTLTSNFTSSTTPLPTTKNSDDEDDDEEDTDYEDFDDLQEAPQSRISEFDSSTALKYLNGVVNLLGLMYSFNGSKSGLKPPNYFSLRSQPRDGGRDQFAESVNQLAQDRFHPTTATKKFKLQQGYSSVDTFPPYDPYAQNAAESYSSNGGKTSYDSDAAMYMVNPAKKDIMPPTEIMNDNMMPAKSPMEDYIAQNDGVDIQQSYSYQIPDGKGKMKHPANFYNAPILPTPSSHDNNDHPWSMKKPKLKMKPSMIELTQPWDDHDDHPNDDHHDSPSDESDDHRPVYYPWMSNPKPMKDVPPPDSDFTGPSYLPWSSNGNKKSKPMPSAAMEEDDHVHPWTIKHKPVGDIAPPPLSKDPPPYFPYLQDDHDQFIDDHEEQEEEDDHQMRDEDRESKRPYTYYHLGRKLWYIPLLFSIYFIVYIGALLLKSIARHKVELPEKLWELHDQDHHHGHDRRRHRQIDQLTQSVHNSISKAKNKFM